MPYLRIHYNFSLWLDWAFCALGKNYIQSSFTLSYYLQNDWWPLVFSSWLVSHAPPFGCDAKVAQSCPTLCDSPGQNTGVGCLSLLQEIFPTQGLNPGLPHSRQILYQLRHKESPRILGRIAYPFSSGSSQPRNWTGVSGIAGGFFTNWASREAWRAFDFDLLDICTSHGCLQSGLSWWFQVSALTVSRLPTSHILVLLLQNTT